jgi:hypothetical protein
MPKVSRAICSNCPVCGGDFYYSYRARTNDGDVERWVHVGRHCERDLRPESARASEDLAACLMNAVESVTLGDYPYRHTCQVALAEALQSYARAIGRKP